MIGLGALRGMSITLREFIGSYAWGKWLFARLGIHSHGIVTVEYPEQKRQLAERFRYFPFLVYDGTAENLRCVSCKICEQECPPACIFIEQAKDEQGRPLRANGRPYPKTFNIDTSICMSCRICVDVCPFDAIEMDKDYELSATERFATMTHDKQRLLKSADYFRQIHPDEAAVVDARLAAKAKKAAPAAPAAGTAPATPAAAGTPATPIPKTPTPPSPGTQAAASAAPTAAPETPSKQTPEPPKAA